MIGIIENLESELKTQLASLANDIRYSEAELVSTKEGYFKVQGALEILDIIKKQIDVDPNKESLDITLG